MAGRRSRKKKIGQAMLQTGKAKIRNLIRRSPSNTKKKHRKQKHVNATTPGKNAELQKRSRRPRDPELYLNPQLLPTSGGQPQKKKRASVAMCIAVIGIGALRMLPPLGLAAVVRQHRCYRLGRGRQAHYLTATVIHHPAASHCTDRRRHTGRNRRRTVR